MAKPIEIGNFPPGWGQSFKADNLKGLKPGGNSLSPFARRVVRTVELGTAASLLASCSTPGAEAASPTINPVAHTGPTLTPEAPTPSIPTIEVGGLKLPDPKISNPELFDVTKPDSPIVKFANAFGVNSEDVASGLHAEIETPDGLPPFAVLRN